MDAIAKRHETLAITSKEDIVQIRQAVRKRVTELGFSLIKQMQESLKK